MSSISKVAVPLVITLMITSGAAMATQAPTVKGDVQAWAEIEAVLLKLTQVRSYRVHGWYYGFEFGLGGAVEVVNPDREHIILFNDGGFYEAIKVGNDTRTRGGSPGDIWMCDQSDSSPPAPFDFLALLGMYPPIMSEVTAARGPAGIIGGTPTQSYTYKPSDWPFVVRLFVADATGLPRRVQWVETQGEQKDVVMQADFFGYDAPIVIELPPCRSQ